MMYDKIQFMGDLSEHFNHRDFTCHCKQCKWKEFKIHLGLVGFLEQIGTHFDKKMKVKYFVGDLIKFYAPFFIDTFKIGIVTKVIKDDKEIFKNTVLEVYGLDGMHYHNVMPFFDDIK